jgi:hypothetical protein
MKKRIYLLCFQQNCTSFVQRVRGNKKVITPTQKVAVSLELSEHGIGQVYVYADDDAQARDGYKLLADVTPKLRELSEACIEAMKADRSLSTK